METEDVNIPAIINGVEARGNSSGIAASKPHPHSNDAAAGRNISNADNGEGKMFFTTSDLIERMNSAVKDANVDVPKADSESGGFELQRKMPDGSYRRAEKSETAAADFQAKMKQASEMIANLNPQQKIEWAKYQRKEGNALFEKGDYTEAMDVYLTCLVAMDQSPASSAVDKTTSTTSACVSEEHFNMQIEKDIKLPVLLNLALSALKLGMLSKAEEFCNFAMEMESGRQSVKAHFRRGKVRSSLGHYVAAELDLDKALELNANVIPCADDSCNLAEMENEKSVILREKQKLSRLINQADRNQKRTRKAMGKLFRGKDGVLRLYPEKRSIQSLDGSTEKEGPNQTSPVQSVDHGSVYDYQPTCFQWYIQMIGRCAQKLLDIIGEEEEGPDMVNALMQDKKNA